MNEDQARGEAVFHRYSHRAMATVFEVLIANEEKRYAEQVASACFQEIDRLEQELSRYHPNSDISRINNLVPHGSVRVGLDTFDCLQLSMEYWKETSGAFDVTTGRLMDCWLGKEKILRSPAPLEVEEARSRTGMSLLELDAASLTVRVHERVPQVDLGAVGKGYTVDRLVDLLREWGVTSALVHGGTSSVYAFGKSGDSSGWPVTLSDPHNPSDIIQRVLLNGLALGGSGLMKGKHILDPRRGCPVVNRRAAWACAATAAASDAVSTACMVMTIGEIEEFCAAHPGMWVILIQEGVPGSTERVARFGPIPVL